MIVIGGDSFSAVSDHPMWHDFIWPGANPNKKINLAWHGAGNFYIAESIKPFIKKNKIKPKKIVIFWSQFFRYDLVVKKPYDKFHGYAGGKCWQFSAGLPAKKWDPSKKEVFEEAIKNKGWDSVIHQSLSKVKETIDLLDDSDIDFNFGFVYPEEQNKIFYQHKKFIPLIFKQWIDQHNLHGWDGHHPSEEGHRLFAEEIKQYL